MSNHYGNSLIAVSLFCLFINYEYLMLSIAPTAGISSGTDSDVASTENRVAVARLLSNRTENIEEEKEGMHVLYSLAGNDTGFIDEFTTSMKSSLLNAPLDRGLTIHIMADTKAYQSLGLLFKETHMGEWQTRNQIAIQVYKVDSKQDDWKEVIEDATGRRHKQTHTIAAFYRLFAFSVLPETVEHVVYMDNDVAMIGNLEGIWALRNSTSMFQWGESECSGFAVINLLVWKKLFWKLNKEVHQKPEEKSGNDVVGDQSMLQKVATYYPERIDTLPDEWDNHMANNLYRLIKSRNKLLTNRPKIGYVHFNGGAGSKEKVFMSETSYSKYKIWSNLRYYASHPWEWVRYQLECQMKDGHGHQLLLNYTFSG
jgi:hypothetical protein